MTNSDYIEVKGPKSLAELVAVIDPAAPRIDDGDEDLVTLEQGGDEYAAVQYDEVDKDAWPYMITVESRSENEGAVRMQAMRILAKINAAGWGYRMTSDADASLLIETQSV